jgi:hypothetical protein
MTRNTGNPHARREGTMRWRSFYWFEWVGAALVGLALVMIFAREYIADPWRTPNSDLVPARGLWAIALWIWGQVVGIFGLLLFVFRPLLWLRWWHCWLVMILAGMSLYAASGTFCDWCCPYLTTQGEYCRFLGKNGMIELVLLGVVFFLVQRQARRRLVPRETK